jgi:signal transduction histidine kinase
VGIRDYLTQVVLNLVLNAIDATDEQGRIHLAAQVDEGWIVLSVEDDGRGISIADRCRLFQPFFTTKAHGTGLGLFVSRQILEDHAGTLSFRSEPGQGSTFLVRVPLARTSAPEPAQGVPSAFQPDRGRTRPIAAALAAAPGAGAGAGAEAGAELP